MIRVRAVGDEQTMTTKGKIQVSTLSMKQLLLRVYIKNDSEKSAVKIFILFKKVYCYFSL